MLYFVWVYILLLFCFIIVIIFILFLILTILLFYFFILNKISWQVFAIGTVGLIFEVSSLYSNAIATVGLPIVPVISVFVFHDKIDRIKGMSMYWLYGTSFPMFISTTWSHGPSKVEDRKQNS